MPQNKIQLDRCSSTVVKEETSLADSASTENQETEPPQPLNWAAVIAKIKKDPASFHSIMVLGARKVNGIYHCMGVKNNRPYFKKRNIDFVIWYDENEEIWSLSDSSALNQQDPDLYGYLDSTAWDVTNISKSKNWCLANSKGEWIETVEMRIQKAERSKGLLNSLLTNSVHESRQAAQAAVEQSVSLMSSFWGDFKTVKRNVQQNTLGIKKLQSNQDIVKEKQRDILGRLDKLEKERNSDKYNDLMNKLKSVEGQVKILSKGSKNSRPSRGHRSKFGVKPSIEDLLLDNRLEEASLNAMRTFLKKKRKQRILIDGKQIVLQGNKSTLLKRIQQLLEKPEEREIKNDDDDNQKEKRKGSYRELRKARQQRALARQKMKDQLQHSNLSRPREPADELQRIRKKRRKYNRKNVSK